MQSHQLCASLVALVAVFASPSAASDQRQLTIEVLADLGSTSLAESAFACFHPVDAINFSASASDPHAGDETWGAVAVGACVLTDACAQLANAQRIAINGVHYIRGSITTADISLFSPNRNASLNARDNGDEVERADSVSSLQAVRSDLARRVDEMKACSAERSALVDRISEHNERATAFVEAREKTSTGSRIKGGGGMYAGAKTYSPDENAEFLYSEGIALKNEQAALRKRCKAYRSGLESKKAYFVYLHEPTAAPDADCKLAHGQTEDPPY